MIMLSNCSRPERLKTETKQVRAIDVLTNVPAAITLTNPSIYREGDTVWVHVNSMRVVNATWYESATHSFRKFVIEKGE